MFFREASGESQTEPDSNTIKRLRVLWNGAEAILRMTRRVGDSTERMVILDNVSSSQKLVLGSGRFRNINYGQVDRK